ncbi:Predicted lipoprotein with conserved Yx(FWY)xxD motif [Modicisalibacter ilicicola DSM 19980]|uniref:Predicted lipoprotein with conserved Yx(FWY)xxD motif n=1 Tax=Modicisalibacter ilicicola DSM 19980 TaxID=1121942 RepID=A0A1M5B0B5_9GAMM|nr:hypothetical protein [Halomonas ilicicola]SHF35928.1 Predicted lipoprotein with conserved Yx(FWY)xxD motif [Halomonas ilicicola DSM 19980]
MMSSPRPASRRYLAPGITAALLLSIAASASAQSATRNAAPMISEQEPYGRYVTDREGHSLYLFEQDEPGSGISTCTDACANAWPPYVTDESPEAGEGIDASKLGTIERDGGTKQVTYAGWPLYYFNGDKQPGDALGQDVQHLGAEWYLVSPEGQMIHQGGRTEADGENQDNQ